MGSSESRVPAMRRQWRFSTPSGACCPIGCTARLHCTRRMAGWCRNWPRGITSRGSCRWCARRCGGAILPRDHGRGGLHGGPRADRGAAGGGRVRQKPGLRLGEARDRHSPSRGASACAAARARGARVPLPRIAGLGGPHPARRRGAASGSIEYSGRHSTMRRGKRSTRRPRCSDCRIRAVPRSRGWPNPDDPADSTFRGRCSTGLGSTSVSVA